MKRFYVFAILVLVILALPPRVKTDGEGNILASRDITVPGFSFSRPENAFVGGALEDHQLIFLETGARKILAAGRYGADNLTVYEKSDGTLVLIHSGQVFRLRRR